MAVEASGEAVEAETVVQSFPNTDVTANSDHDHDRDTNANAESVGVGGSKDSSDSKSEFKMQHIADMLSKLKLNPQAKEFFPASYLQDRNRGGDDQLGADNLGPAPTNNRRRRNNYNQGRRRLNRRAFRAEREDSIKRTVYVSEIDQDVTEERLAALFSGKCGQVVDCRICGDPHSCLRFAFVEFADEKSAKEALTFCGTVVGFHPIRVLPSKTAILPVNPTFLPKSEDEREMCARTVYCTNIDKQISHAEVKFFFEACCGQVSRLRLLGDNVHSTRIAFVEFAMAESAIAALNCSGTLVGTLPIRVSPSKTPVRPRISRPGLY